MADTAESPNDFVDIDGDLTFSPGVTALDIPIDVVDDEIFEGEETLALVLSNSTNARIERPSAIGRIIDNESPPQLNVTDAIANEQAGGAQLVFSLTLSDATAVEASVDYATMDVDAVAGGDYVETGGTAIFPPGTTVVQVTVPVIDDSLDENDETLELAFSAPDMLVLANPATGTIIDDDAPPVIAISGGDVTESAPELEFTVSLSAPSGKVITVDYTTADASATAGSDYSSVSGTLELLPGETSATLTVPILSDSVFEGQEAFSVSLSAPTNATLGNAVAIGTIVDDDPPPTDPPAAASISDIGVVEGDAGTTVASFAVSLSEAESADVALSYVTVAGTAVESADFIGVAGDLVIAAGMTNGSIDVEIIGDTIDEPDETFQVVLSNPQGNLVLSDVTATATIQDDDQPPELSLTDVIIDEGNVGNSVANVIVNLSAASELLVTVDYASNDVSATAGEDYSSVSGTLSFAPGETSKSVAVPILADLLDETDETLELRLTNAQSAVIVDGLANVTILDDDTPPSLSIVDASIPEGDAGTTVMFFALSLSVPSGQSVYVDYATADLTATAGSDYTAASSTVSFSPGETAQTIGIEIAGDESIEDDETFSLTLDNAVNATIANGSATGSIIDDDGQPLVSVSDAQVIEGDSATVTLAFDVTLSEPSTLDVTVNYATTGSTATPGIDFIAATGALTIPAGATSGTIDVDVYGDTIDEIDETFDVTLTNPINAGLLDAAGVATINDDDTPPSLTISSASITEGDAGSSDLLLSVDLSAASGLTVSVDFASSDVSATAGDDYSAVAGTLSFDPGVTSRNIEIPVLADLLDEDDETLNVLLSSPQNATITTGTGIATINDDDTPPSLTISSPSVTEGDAGPVPMTFSIDLSAASGKSISLSYATGDDTAVAGADYTAATGALVFDPGQTNRTIVVDVLGDEDDEGDESLFVTLSAPVNVTFANSQATGTIIDDDAVATWGLDTRPSNLTCVAPDRPNIDATIELSEPFPSLPNFSSPIAMAQPPGDDSRWFIAEQAGRVLFFDNDPAVSSATVAIDITGQVNSSNTELGLLGMAFHPDYSSSGTDHEGELFLSYTIAGPISRISRFTTADDWATWNEEIVVEAYQDTDYHNGGNIAFGPDGYFYIGFGDGGGEANSFDRAEDTTNLLGTILRIDVDGGIPYSIPPDNPFFGNAVCAADHSSVQACPEIYAWGLRNPWRWSFDAGTGQLWLGDVGEWTWEEIDLVELGGNYGWDTREGAHCFEPSSGCDTTGLIDPVVEYDHSLGQAVVGGYVYRGSAIPDLAGRFLFADTYTGRIWALEDDGQGGFTRTELLDTDAFISSFAQASDGELFLLNLADGGILEIVQGSGSGTTNTIPDLLADTGCFDSVDPTQPASGLIPYTIDAPFWSDGAEKERFLAIPDGTTISIDASDDWLLPPGTIIVKNFRLGGKLFETRLLMRHPDGIWAGYTYEWDDTETTAMRVIGGQTKFINGQEWIYPSEGDCDRCHTQSAGAALGPESAQLNTDFTYPSTGRTANQLVTLDHIALFDTPLPDVPNGQPVLADPADTQASLTDRARAYLHTNCAQCHRPLGPTQSTMDLRYQTPLSAINACDATPVLGDLGVANARLIAPGDSSRSILLNRMSRRDVHGMPPLGSNAVDIIGAALIAAWIDSLATCN